MRTRNADAPKSATPAKRTPPARKAAARNSPMVAEPASQSATPPSTGTKRTSAAKAKQAKKNTEAPPTPTPSSGSKAETVEEKASVDAAQVTPEAKTVSGTKTTRKVVKRKVVKRTPRSAGAASKRTPKSDEAEKTEVEESVKEEEPHDVNSSKNEDAINADVEESSNKEEPDVQNDMEMEKEDHNVANVEDSNVANVEGHKVSNVKDHNVANAEEHDVANAEEHDVANVEDHNVSNFEDHYVSNVEDHNASKVEEHNVADVKEPAKEEEVACEEEQPLIENSGKAIMQEDSVVADEVEGSKNQDPEVVGERVEVNEETETKVIEDKLEPESEPVKMEENIKEDSKGEDAHEMEDAHHTGEKIDECSQHDIQEQLGEEDIVLDDAVEHGEEEPMQDDADEHVEEKLVQEDASEHGEEKLVQEDAAEHFEEKPVQEDAAEHGDEKLVLEDAADCGEQYVQEDVAGHGEEAEVLEDERAQLDAIVAERKIRKELEIFVGGLDRNVVEEDVKKAFNNVGEVVAVRLHKDSSTNKNKGYAFVRFATKEQASRALSEMKNPVICGKRCGTAPSEDNDTLFLGNICNTWTKEAIKQKLKDYGIEEVENITLVPDAQHEGLSRGFAFLEFSCHADAMQAFKRLQKPDVIFGHPERTAKVAFAEPLREPDPEVMAQVKSVFVDGLPPHWDEDSVREKFKCYGEIMRIMLARNMSTARRKDFGFVDFATHEAAVACIEGINNTEFRDGNLKTKVKVRLSNPMPKIQAVKGGMSGGFRIGQGSGGNFSRSGRGFVRGGNTFGRANYQRGRGLYNRGRGQPVRMGFPNEPNFNNPYPPFQGRQNFGRGGRWPPLRGAHQATGGGAVPMRTNYDRQRHVPADRGQSSHAPFRRQPMSQEEGFNRPFVGSHFDDPYFYEDAAHGIKRPYFMTDQEPDYTEPSRIRPRFDYTDPSVPVRGTQYPDTFGARTGPYSHDYYGSDYGGGAYPSSYGGNRPYGGRYYY